MSATAAQPANEAPAGPWFVSEPTDGGWLVLARGRWNGENAAALESELDRLADALPLTSPNRLELSGVEEFDTFGVWLVEKLGRKLKASGVELSVSGIAPQLQPLFDSVARVSADPGQRPPGLPRDPLTTTGVQAFQVAGAFGEFLTMLGATVIALARVVRHPASFRFTSTIAQFDRVAWQALPIIVLVTFIIGVIIAQQGFFHFRNFGADLYVIDMIGFLVMRELGVLLVAIMVAGRSGSAYTAELGSMKMREEIDALKTMGLDPVAVLVLPRTLVLTVALPVLAFIGSMAALVGAGLTAVYYAELSPHLFIDRLKDAISMDHFLVGLIKAPFIGAAIAIIACSEGFRVSGSSTSLGRHTTQAVVKSIFTVIFLDGLFALFFTAIRM